MKTIIYGIKEFMIMLVIGLSLGAALTWASHYGAMHRSYAVYDEATKKDIWVTEATIKEHFAIAPDNTDTENCNWFLKTCVVDGKTFLDPRRYN